MVLLGCWSLAATASAQDQVSVEVRLETPGTVQRVSSGVLTDEWNDYHLRSTHVVLGGGVRVFGPEGHGALLEVSFLPDPDSDSLFDEGYGGDIPMLTGQIGYAYRHHIPRRGGERAITITPSVSATVGHARCASDFRPGCTRPGERVGLFGARVGLDFDFHFRRGFIGWGLRYGVVGHREGVGLDTSHLFGFSFFPRFGFVLGRRITKPRAPPAVRQRNSLIGL